VGEIDDKQRRILQNIYKNCENMINLVEDLLDVTAIQTGKLKLDRKDVDLNQFLADIYTNAQIWAEAKSIDVKLKLPSQLPTISFDPNRIEQVVNNLITNAIKFSYPETTVTISASETRDFVEISVEDEGQGIPEEDIEKIFSEFARARVRPTAGEKSTGLGLAIAKKMVDAHGGKIWVESEVDAGSKFTFSLPKQIEK
jgi:signal transduction histidine kinase